MTREDALERANEVLSNFSWTSRAEVSPLRVVAEALIQAHNDAIEQAEGSWSWCKACDHGQKVGKAIHALKIGAPE